MARRYEETEIDWRAVLSFLMQLALLGLAIANLVLNTEILVDVEDEQPCNTTAIRQRLTGLERHLYAHHKTLSAEIEDIALIPVLARCIQREQPDLLVPESPNVSDPVVKSLPFNVGQLDLFNSWDEQHHEYVIPHNGVYVVETKLTPFVVQNRGRSIYIMRRYSAASGETSLDQVSIWCNKNSQQGESPFDKSLTSFFNRGDRVAIAYSYNDNDVQPPPPPSQLPTRISHADLCGANLLLIYAVNTLH